MDDGAQLLPSEYKGPVGRFTTTQPGTRFDDCKAEAVPRGAEALVDQGRRGMSSVCADVSLPIFLILYGSRDSYRIVLKPPSPVF